MNLETNTLKFITNNIQMFIYLLLFTTVFQDTIKHMAMQLHTFEGNLKIYLSEDYVLIYKQNINTFK